MFFCEFVGGKKKKKSTTNTALLRQQSFTFFPQQMTFAVDCNGSCSTSDGKGACSQPGLLAPAEDCWTSIGNPHFFSPPASLCSTHALQKKQGDPCVYRMVQRMWGASRGVFLAGLTVAPHLEVGTDVLCVRAHLRTANHSSLGCFHLCQFLLVGATAHFQFFPSVWASWRRKGLLNYFCQSELRLKPNSAVWGLISFLLLCCFFFFSSDHRCRPKYLE